MRATAYVVLVGASVAAAVSGARALLVHMVSTGGPVSRVLHADQGVAEQRRGRVTLTQDWHERIRAPEFWRDRGRPSSPYRPERPEYGTVRPNLWQSIEPMQRPNDGEGTYRTVCVRLCDGYFFPVSYATGEDGFERDKAQCEKSCSAPARLYVYKNPGEEPAMMRTPEGQPYSSLPTANLFRTRYVESCRCTPQPWEKVALDRHRIYALEAAQRKGDKDAREQLAQLRAHKEAERRTQEQRRAAALASIRAGSVAARTPLPQVAIVVPKSVPPTTPAIPGQPSPMERTEAVRSAAIGGDLMIMRLGMAPSTSQTVGASMKRKRKR